MPANTPHGLPYPLGTDFTKDGDDAIKALALAVDGTITTLWNSDVVGAYNSAKPVKRMSGFAGGATDASGFVHVATPVGTTCILGVYIQAAFIAADNQDGWFPVLRADITTLASITFQAMKAQATPCGNVFLGYSIAVDYQI